MRMNRSFLLVRLTLLLSMTVSCTIVSYYTTYELISFDDRKVNYAEAKRLCENAGRYLAKINSQEIADALINVLTKQQYYIGLIKRGIRYYWHDGTYGPLKEYTRYYNNWESGYGYEHECAVADGLVRGRWKDYECSHKAYFVCQTTPTASVKIGSNSLVVDNDTDVIICSTRKETSCSTSVTWRRLRYWFVDIPDSQSSNVYQVKSITSSTPPQLISKLVLTKADISHEGRYNCIVRVGTKWASENAEVSVPTTPTINKIFQSKCSSHVNVSWISNIRARGYRHLLKAFPIANKTDITELLFDASETYNATLNLKPTTEYSIEISVCKTGACPRGIPAKRTVITKGQPSMVSSPTILNVGSNCSIVWNQPNIILDQITGYRVHVTKQVAGSRNPATNATESYEVTNTSYAFEAQTNIKYFADIQAVNCAGRGRTVAAKGFCAGAAQAPDDIEEPTIITDHYGATKIAIKIPDETKGLISCLFVIVSYEEANVTSLGKYNLNNLMTANGHSEKNEYIAVAISYSKFLDSKNMTLLLGDRSATLCDLHKNIDGVTYIHNLSLAGRNKPLFIKEKFRVYTVAAVPYKGKVMFRRSEYAIWNQTPEYEPTTQTTIPECETCQNCTSPSIDPEAKGYQIDAKYLAIMTLFIPLLFIAWLLGRYQGRRVRNLSESIEDKKPDACHEVEIRESSQSKISDLDPPQQEEVHLYTDIKPVCEVPVVDSGYEEYQA